MNDLTDRRPIEPNDLYGLQAVGEVAIHPRDGSVVYSITWPDEATDSNRSQLHVHGDPPTADHPRQISYGHADRSPRFSPKGTRLAFVRTQPKKPASLMCLDWASRQVDELASFADGIDDVCWVDEHRLAVLAPRRPADQHDVDDEELARRPRIVTRVTYRFNGRDWTHDRLRQVSLVDIGSGGAQVSPLEGLIGESSYDLASVDHEAVAVSPDGSMVAVIAATDSDADLSGVNHVWVHDLSGDSGEGGAPSRCLTEPGGWWQGLLWHPQGSLVAIGSTDASVHGFARPYRLEPDGEGPTVLGPNDVNAMAAVGAARGMVPVDGGALVSSPRNGGIAIEEYRLDNTTVRTRCHGRLQVLAFDASVDGSRIVAAITSVDRPAELWQVAPGDLQRLVSLNDELLAELDLAVTESVSVECSDGHTIEAFLTRPPRSVAGNGSPRPGLVYVHGGPLSQYGYNFFDEFQLAAAAGYVVIGGNPRGSDGYGEDWATSIVGVLGTIDWEDVSAITDHLVALPDVDGQRIGIGGGSYGGFMASWAIGHSDRYRAALIERAVTSWHSMLGTSDIASPFVPALLNATVEADPDAIARQSPLSYADAIKTPALILHSEHDWRCPIEQAEQLFVAIRRNGGDATLVRFPDENHELSRSGSPKHRVERFAIIHDFFAKHLGVDT